jgi:hypothetical protein
MATVSRNTVVPDKDVQLMLECSDSDLSSIDFETDSDHSVDDVAVIDTLVNGGDDNEAVAASVKNFVWEGMSNYKGQSYEADRAPSEARSDCMDGQLLQLT